MLKLFIISSKIVLGEIKVCRRLMSFPNFIVNDVGDANSIFLQDYENPMMLDFGIQNKDFLDDDKFFLKKQLEFTRELIVSHYHKDHFNGLYYVNDKNIEIRKLYYPYIPRFQSSEKLIKEIHFLAFLQSIEYIKSGSCASDLISLVRKVSSTEVEACSLHIGKTIGQYEVIWPPKSADDFDVPTLARNIKIIEDKIKEIPEIEKLWSTFDRAEIDDNQLLKIDYEDLTFNRDILENLKEPINEIESKVKRITNRFSICLYLADNFLFLGDLEQKEIRACLENLLKQNDKEKICVKYFITPHHGTHYSDCIRDFIHATYVISSNGKERIKDYNLKYNEIGDYYHCTCCNGYFYGMGELSEKVIISALPGTIFIV